MGFLEPFLNPTRLPLWNQQWSKRVTGRNLNGEDTGHERKHRGGAGKPRTEAAEVAFPDGCFGTFNGLMMLDGHSPNFIPGKG